LFKNFKIEKFYQFWHSQMSQHFGNQWSEFDEIGFNRFVIIRRILLQYFMSFELIYENLFAFCCLQTFANKFPSIDPNDIKILRLDASSYGESIEPYFVKFWSLVVEIMRSNVCPIISILENSINFSIYKYYDVSATSD
jgi:hypothetical protein